MTNAVEVTPVGDMEGEVTAKVPLASPLAPTVAMA